VAYTEPVPLHQYNGTKPHDVEFYRPDADGGYQVGRGSRQDSDMAYANLYEGRCTIGQE